MEKRKFLKVFMIVFVGALGTALAVFYRNFVIYSQYDNPPDLNFYPIAFEYLSFTLVVFLFPWSWRKGGPNVYRRALFVSLTALLFTMGYIFMLNYLEWNVRGQSYDFWQSFRFTALHSGFYTLVIYSIISIALHFIGFTRQNQDVSSDYLKQIPFKQRNETTFIPVKDAILFESNGNYVDLYTDIGECYLIRARLQRLEEQLDPQVFRRIHRRYLVRLGSIKRYRSDHQGGYIIQLNNQKEIRVSKTYAASIRSYLRN